jgi:beta-phosphoglucomutase-like phosphatase (HAD superfamily)
MSDPSLPAALIFDVDGTLAETEDAHRDAFNAAFEAAGLDWRWDEALYLRLLDVTGGKERIRHYAAVAGLPAPAAEAVAALHADQTERYVAAVAAGRLGLRPGVARLIKEARAAGVPVALATTTSLPNVESLLAATLGPDAIGWFAAIGAGDVVAAKKPAPDVYVYVLDRLGLDPARCVAFEDSENGVASARAAGLPVVVTVSRYTAHQSFPDALAVLDHLGEADAPCAVMAGLPAGGGMVDLATLARWLAPSAG